MITCLGENIKRYREMRGLSKSELSKMSNVALSSISQIETGARENLTSSSIDKIARALNVTTDKLLSTNEDICEVSDFLEAVSFILTDDDISIDGEVLTPDEKEKLKFAMEMAAITIIKKRENKLK